MPRLPSAVSGTKEREFKLVQGPFNGYRAREDITMLPPGILVRGSQNVLTNTAQRIAKRRGYSVDGQTSTSAEPITSSFDWTKLLNNDRHLRQHGTVLQYRYESPLGVVEWRDLATGFTTNSMNFTTLWDALELFTKMLFVNGSSFIYEWSGGITTYASSTVNTITKQGTTTWAQEGFYLNGVRAVVLNGATYTYTGGENTTTLTGVAPAVVAGAPGDVIHQEIRTTANAAMTALPPGFINDGIANLLEQIYIGSLNSSYIYISKLSDPYDYSFSTPRIPGDGAKKTMTGYWRSFMNQEQDMYISAGADLWYKTNFTQTTTSVSDGVGGAISTVYEQINLEQLKTTFLQASQSQAVTSKIQNDIIFLSNEPIINRLGRVDNILVTPQMTDISYPIVDDMNNYDFTGASLMYFRQFIYVAVPAQGLTLVYNMTNPANPYWECPQTIPVSRFAVIDDALYGHSSFTTETYKLFDTFRDRYHGGHSGIGIDGIARFSFQNYGVRSTTKSMNEFYVEGYISMNTLLTIGIQYDIDGCATDTNYILRGDDARVVCIPFDDNSLGKFPLGTNPLGANLNQDLSTSLPPKFRVIKTFPRIPFYEEQSYFESSGKDEQWELVAFGGNVSSTSEGNVAITE